MKRLTVGVSLLVAVALAGSAFAAPPAAEPARTPFQKRVIVTPLGTGFQTVLLEVPVGKRLVIENVSVITRSPAGMRMEVNYFTYLDLNGDGVGDLAEITFHRVALVDQGTFDTTSIATANDKVLVFADGLSTNHHIGVQARYNVSVPDGTPPGQAQFTFSGYLESLPQ